jgi:hypothetical protein
MNENVYKKVLFRFYNPLFEEEMVETLWAIEIDSNKGFYQIDNIPFYVPSISSDDIVIAEFDENEQYLIFKEVIEYSGNSVIQIIQTAIEKENNHIVNNFLELGCQSEGLNENYFTIEIPKSINYEFIKNELDKLEEYGKISYSESCLSDKHKNDLL